MSKTKGESLVNRWISIEYGECLPTLQVANEGRFCAAELCVTAAWRLCLLPAALCACA